MSGTRKPKTETFVIRKKNREELLRKSVDTGAFEVVIEDRVTMQQNGVKTINTGKKKFEVDSNKASFEVERFWESYMVESIFYTRLKERVK